MSSSLAKGSSKKSTVQIGPSVLAADFLRLGADLEAITKGGADYVHFDVMDGQFVPNISIGLPVLEAVHNGTPLPVDVHLMIAKPEIWIEQFAKAGADSITVHVEATSHIHRVVQAIRTTGTKAGVALNPGTPIAAVFEILPFVDTILVMTVNPGFGGQAFIGEMVSKIERLAELRDKQDLGLVIQVDGGITPETTPEVVKAGATSLVAGTSVFGGQNSVAQNIEAIRKAAR